ncbi:hypothetical protein ACQ4M4_25800 [Leptolyngbya sp. AN02str]|uniref:hypothetical protein n=1 Tax=Leptolyngbya sp. AN02str TaxID=3423363 RepID=UPI003D3228D7
MNLQQHEFQKLQETVVAGVLRAIGDSKVIEIVAASSDEEKANAAIAESAAERQSLKLACFREILPSLQHAGGQQAVANEIERLTTSLADRGLTILAAATVAATPGNLSPERFADYLQFRAEALEMGGASMPEKLSALDKAKSMRVAIQRGKGAEQQHYLCTSPCARG